MPAKKKKKRRKKPNPGTKAYAEWEKKKWEKKADRALSKRVRQEVQDEYGGCPLCIAVGEEGPVEVCFHFVTRKRKILRWRRENVTATCRTCNYLEQFFPDESRAWFIREFGVDKYLELVDEAVKKPKWEPDLGYLKTVVDLNK
jgi:hypothetical protein